MEYDQDVSPIRICIKHGVYLSGPRGSLWERMCPDCHTTLWRAANEYTDCSAYLIWLEKYSIEHGLKLRP